MIKRNGRVYAEPADCDKVADAIEKAIGVRPIVTVDNGRFIIQHFEGPIFENAPKNSRGKLND